MAPRLKKTFLLRSNIQYKNPSNIGKKKNIFFAKNVILNAIKKYDLSILR